ILLSLSLRLHVSSVPSCSSPCAPRDLHSFPTGRSSDLEHGGEKQRTHAVGPAQELFPVLDLELRLQLPLPVIDLQLQVLGAEDRSEEHTSESSHQIISYAVFCLKKKTLDHASYKQLVSI